VPRAEQPAAVELTGAGSTFDAPFFSAAFAHYHQLHPTVSVRYSAVGSGDGIKEFSAGAVDFGASDVPMTPAEQAAAKGGSIVQVPVDLGAVVVSYNFDNAGGLAVPLHLTGAVLARIYLGQITNWDDPAITALNPRDALPDEQIKVVHRSDSSGTTYIFTDYLSAVAPGH
jgi:phosphate transport system substrate-binding protein